MALGSAAFLAWVVFVDGFFFGAGEGLTFLGLLSFFLSPGLSRIGVDAGLLRGSYSGPNLLGSGTVMAKVMPTARLGGGVYRRLSLKMEPARAIPAGAGAYSRSPWEFVVLRDHPRRFGALPPFGRPMSQDQGPSPVVRGRASGSHPRWSHRRWSHRCWRERGTISERAERTRKTRSATMTGMDHLRACGAYTVLDCGRWFCRGSSPPVRSVPESSRWRRPGQRTIPVPAGRTGATCRSSPSRPDHPRSSGTGMDVS